MVSIRSSRIAATLAIALLAFSGSSSVVSAAKCTPKNKLPALDETTPPEVEYGASQTGGSTTQGSAAGPPSTFESSAASQETQGSSFETPSTPVAGSADTQVESSAGSQTQGPTPATSTTGSSASTPTTGSSDVSQSNSTTPSTGSGDHASFGKVISSSGQCVTGDPETYVTRADVDWVWKNTMEEYIPQFKNLIFDQLVTGKGSLTYCVRWDNDQKLEKATASKFQEILNKQMDLWHRWLVGYECWPFEKVDITIVGYAVKDKSIMDWSDDSLGTIYEGILDAEGSPKCPDECYKHQNQAASSDTSSCKGGAFDMSFWPSTKPGDGAIGTGGDWGQRVEVNDMLNSMGQEHMNVLLHEMGHGFGMPEMYVAKNKPSTFPACVMDNSMELTDGDGWLLRSVLEQIKSRYDFSK